MANLNVNFGDMDGQASRLRDARDRLLALRAEVMAQVGDLVSTGFVTDRAEGQVRALVEQFESGGAAAASALDGLSSYLQSTADALRQTDQSLGDFFGE